MREIETALLSGQSKVTIHGIEISLKPLKPDTTACKQREAKKRANEIIQLLNS